MYYRGSKVFFFFFFEKSKVELPIYIIITVKMITLTLVGHILSRKHKKINRWVIYRLN